MESSPLQSLYHVILLMKLSSSFCHLWLFCFSLMSSSYRLLLLIMRNNVSAHANKKNTQNTAFSVGVVNFDKTCLPQIQNKGEKATLAMTIEMWGWARLWWSWGYSAFAVFWSQSCYTKVVNVFEIEASCQKCHIISLLIILNVLGWFFYTVW